MCDSYDYNGNKLETIIFMRFFGTYVVNPQTMFAEVIRLIIFLQNFNLLLMLTVGDDRDVFYLHSRPTFKQIHPCNSYE